MKKLKKVTKRNAELICFKAANEGFDYCFTEYSDWKNETKGTSLEPLIEAYRKAKENLERELFDLRAKYGFEEP